MIAARQCIQAQFVVGQCPCHLFLWPSSYACKCLPVLHDNLSLLGTAAGACKLQKHVLCAMLDCKVRAMTCKRPSCTSQLGFERHCSSSKQALHSCHQQELGIRCSALELEHVKNVQGVSACRVQLELLRTKCMQRHSCCNMCDCNMFM